VSVVVEVHEDLFEKLTINLGAIATQGPHHVAKKSTTTNPPVPLILASKSACNKYKACFN
jgi:hypothetical protein